MRLNSEHPFNSPRHVWKSLRPLNVIKRVPEGKDFDVMGTMVGQRPVTVGRPRSWLTTKKRLTRVRGMGSFPRTCSMRRCGETT